MAISPFHPSNKGPGCCLIFRIRIFLARPFSGAPGDFACSEVGTASANLDSASLMSNDSTPCICAAFKAAFSLLLAMVFLAPALRAQEAVRPSLAGEAAAEARHQAIENIPYNLRLGPVRFLFSTTLGIEYNDNINLAETGQEDDVIIRPQFNLDAIWPVTALNTLKLDIGMGYAFYINHPNANTNGVIISPGSQLSFDIFIQDFRINLHDRFSLQQDPVAEAELS